MNTFHNIMMITSQLASGAYHFIQGLVLAYLHLLANKTLSSVCETVNFYLFIFTDILSIWNHSVCFQWHHTINSKLNHLQTLHLTEKNSDFFKDYYNNCSTKAEKFNAIQPFLLGSSINRCIPSNMIARNVKYYYIPQ